VSASAKRGQETRADVSVVIPARNAGSTIERCLAALADQTVSFGEVIVVDDGSSDGTADIARRMGATVVTQGHGGAGAARNRGARAASGDLLLFTDADCAPRRDWVERLVAALGEEGVVAARGVCTSDQDEAVARFAQLEYDEKHRQLARRRYVDLVSTDSAAYRRETFSEFGGFDEGFVASEDQDLSFRIARSGLKIVFEPGAVVTHRHRPTLRGYARRKFWIGYAKARIGRRHPAMLIQDAYTPQNLKLQVACTAVTLLGLALAPFRRDALTLARVGGLGFAASAVPILSFGLSRDPRLVPLLPGLLLLRALALGSGFTSGVVTEARRRAH
jgi:glycosyltransferase involved in cell wall biosynthesis